LTPEVTSILGGAAQGALTAYQTGKPVGQGALDGARKPAETVIGGVVSDILKPKPTPPKDPPEGKNPTGGGGGGTGSGTTGCEPPPSGTNQPPVDPPPRIYKA
jgi:hypothetical protein